MDLFSFALPKKAINQNLSEGDICMLKKTYKIRHLDNVSLNWAHSGPKNFQIFQGLFFG